MMGTTIMIPFGANLGKIIFGYRSLFWFSQHPTIDALIAMKHSSASASSPSKQTSLVEFAHWRLVGSKQAIMPSSRLQVKKNGCISKVKDSKVKHEDDWPKFP